MKHVRLLIVGGGPAGYTATIYASRAGLAPVLYEGQMPGGQLVTTTVIENFPGFPEGKNATELVEGMRDQAKRFGAEILSGEVVKVDFSKKPLTVFLDDKSAVTADAIIVATGANAKFLGIEDEKKYLGMGVSTCATCDGFFFRKKIVSIVGGGDSACEEALYLASLASKVYMIVRKNYLRATEIMQKRVMENAQIEVIFGSHVVKILGEGRVENLLLANEQNEEKTLKTDGLFLAIGHKPNTDIFSGSLDLDEEGYIKTVGNTRATSVAGVFAAGDVCDRVYRQAITASADGAKAAIEAQHYLERI